MIRSIEELEKLVAAYPMGGKALFVVDQTEGELSNSVFLRSANYLVMDAEKLNMKKTVKKQNVSDILEECRFQLTFAMKYGKVLVIRFGNSMTDFKNTFNDNCCPELRAERISGAAHHHLSYLPFGFMLRGGQQLHEESAVRALYRREDIVEMLEEADDDTDPNVAVPVCHPNFKVILTTSMDLLKLDDFHFHAKYGLPAPRDHFDVRVFNTITSIGSTKGRDVDDNIAGLTSANSARGGINGDCAVLASGPGATATATAGGTGTGTGTGLQEAAESH
jgi:hypothetical protein